MDLDPPKWWLSFRLSFAAPPQKKKATSSLRKTPILGPSYYGYFGSLQPLTQKCRPTNLSRALRPSLVSYFSVASCEGAELQDTKRGPQFGLGLKGNQTEKTPFWKCTKKRHTHMANRAQDGAASGKNKSRDVFFFDAVILMCQLQVLSFTEKHPS